MKAYINEVDWADEGDIFFFSLASEEKLQAMKELIDIYDEFELLDIEEMYWGTNEAFEFGGNDFIQFIDEAVDITDEELAVFNKFGVTGFDIYDRIEAALYKWLFRREYQWKTGPRNYIPEWITQEDLDRIKPVFLKIFEQKEWDRVQTLFNEQNSDDFKRNCKIS